MNKLMTPEEIRREIIAPLAEILRMAQKEAEETGKKIVWGWSEDGTPKARMVPFDFDGDN